MKIAQIEKEEERIMWKNESNNAWCACKMKWKEQIQICVTRYEDDANNEMELFLSWFRCSSSARG